MTIDFLKGPQTEKQYVNLEFYRKGGMGEIYIADDIIDSEKKAIKIIPVDNNEEFELLQTEAKIALSLNHENIIKTYFTGEFENKGTKYLYFVMPYNTTGSLRDHIANKKDLHDIKTALTLMLDLCTGLEYAHDFIIHRDLKPENILVDSSSRLLLCDFGLAKLINSKTRTKTYKGSGTLPYMAPESWLYDSNTNAMDIYSLGIIFFEILTLKAPFIASTDREYQHLHLYSSLPNIMTIRSDIPVKIVETISKMTNKRYQDRYATISEVKLILESVLKNSEKNDGESSVDRLVKKASEKLTAISQKELETKKASEMEDSKRKHVEYSINSLFQKFTDRIDVINGSLERNKITYRKMGDSLYINFLEKEISIDFFMYDDIKEYVSERKRRFYSNQEQRFGMIMQELPPSALEKDNIILIGKCVLSTKRSREEKWGYNLILKKGQNDMYGEWWVAWFDDSAMLAKHPLEMHYTINPPEFYTEYEFGVTSITHVRKMAQNTFDGEGVDPILEKLLE